MAKKMRPARRENNLVAKHSPSTGAGPHTDRKYRQQQIRGHKHRIDMAGEGSRHDHPPRQALQNLVMGIMTTACA